MIGGHGFVAAMVFVVALAVEVLDEKLFQGMGDTQGHVVVHLRDAEGHADWLVVAVHGTRLGLHCRIVEVDAGGEATVLRYIRAVDMSANDRWHSSWQPFLRTTVRGSLVR